MFSFFKKPFGKIVAAFIITAAFLFSQYEARAATSFIGASNLIATNGSAPGAITPNASTANGDLLVFYHYSAVTGGNETVTPPAGFTSVFNSVTANRGLVAVGWRIKQAGDTTFTASVTNHSTGGGGETIVEWIETFRGTDTTNPIVNFTPSLSTWTSSLNIGPISAPTTATVTDGDMVVVFGGRFNTASGQTVLLGDSLTWATQTRNSTGSGANASAVTQTGLNASGVNQTVTAKTISTTGTAAAGGGRMFIIKKVPDVTPPTPNPMTFASLPANDSAVQISMTSSVGSDATTPVNYLFTLSNTNCGANAGTGGTTSSWQSSTSYINSGLQANKCYGYTVTARDSVSPTPNTGTASSISSTYTSANVPGTPALGGATTNSLNLTNAENSNPASNPTTNFAVQVVTTTDATWLNKWVNTSGNASTTAVWMTDAQLDALVLHGLQSSTLYGVKVKARNQDTDETALSAEGQGTTSTPSASGTVSALPTSCTISSGASTCTVPFTWSISNASAPNLYNSTTVNQYSTSASGSGVSYPITNGSNTVQVRDSSSVLNSTAVTGSCTSGTSWNGSSCAVIVIYYNIIATSGANGAVTPTGTTTIAQGDSQIYAITPDTSYQVATLTVDGGSVTASTTYTFSTVTADHTITATFSLIPITHTITSGAGSHGTIDPFGAIVVADGASQAFAITPDSGFYTATLLMDGGQVSTSSPYTFTNVTSDHTISATFALIPTPPGSYTIIANQNPNGAVTPPGSSAVAASSSLTYAITPNSGYDVGSLIIDSFPLASTSTAYTFTNIGANHTIEATFIALPGETPVVVAGRRLPSITFSGKAFPGGKVSIVQKELGTEIATTQQDITAIDGSFRIRFVDVPVGAHSFGLLIKDPEGRTSQTKFFLLDANKGDEVYKDIVTPPTIDILNGQVSRGGNVKVFGYASPGHTIRVYLNDILTKEALAGRGGVYSFDLPTGALPFGQHKVRAKQINLDGGKESDFSTARTFIVSKLAVVKADFNGDGKIDIKDWSIFLARFTSRDKEIKLSVDLNGDGKTDISDFSIFIKTIKKK